MTINWLVLMNLLQLSYQLQFVWYVSPVDVHSNWEKNG